MMKKVFLLLAMSIACYADWQEVGYWNYADQNGCEYVCTLYQQFVGTGLRRVAQNSGRGIVGISKYDSATGWGKERFVSITLPANQYLGTGQRAFDLELSKKWNPLEAYATLDLAAERLG